MALLCDGVITAEVLPSNSISDAVIKCVDNKELREGRVYLTHNSSYSPLQWGSYSGRISKRFTLYVKDREI